MKMKLFGIMDQQEIGTAGITPQISSVFTLESNLSISQSLKLTKKTSMVSLALRNTDLQSAQKTILERQFIRRHLTLVSQLRTLLRKDFLVQLTKHLITSQAHQTQPQLQDLQTSMM